MKWKARLSSAALLRQAARCAGIVASVLDMRDVFFFVGLAAICQGVSQIYPPAAWITFGAVIAWKAR